MNAIHHTLISPNLHGPVNVVSPDPFPNAEFTRVLGRVLGRPSVLPVPAFALRLILGQMADEALLASARVKHARLEDTGFSFEHPELEGALEHLLAR